MSCVWRCHPTHWACAGWMTVLRATQFSLSSFVLAIGSVCPTDSWGRWWSSVICQPRHFSLGFFMLMLWPLLCWFIDLLFLRMECMCVLWHGKATLSINTGIDSPCQFYFSGLVSLITNNFDLFSFISLKGSWKKKNTYIILPIYFRAVEKKKNHNLN